MLDAENVKGSKECEAAARAVAALLPVRDAAERTLGTIRECERLQGHEHLAWNDLDTTLAAARAAAEGGKDGA